MDIATPHSTLLLGALDKTPEQMSRASGQTTFRISSTRGVTPNFADMLTAEAEALVISEAQPVQPVEDIKPPAPVAKVKAMSATNEDKVEKGRGKTKGEMPREEKVCRFWGSEDGCRKGQGWMMKTGIALELPPGSYGRIAPRSSLAIRGIETGAGVINRDLEERSRCCYATCQMWT